MRFGKSEGTNEKETPSDWFLLEHPDFSPARIADSGQCFRMTAVGERTFRLIAGGRVLLIRETEDAPGRFSLSCSEEEFCTFWRSYFDLDHDADYEAARAKVPKSDVYLQRAMRYGYGIRILRQEPFETLISFIISQCRSVPAIRTAVEKLSTAFGTRLQETALTGADRSLPPLYAFPTPVQLAAASPEALGACGLGYRTSYVAACARRVADGEIDLNALSTLSTEEVIEALRSFQGVGVKVASCTALFGYHRLDAAPVDVWMDRVIRSVYGGTFPEAYHDRAGILQQYLFYYARTERTAGKKAASA